MEKNCKYEEEELLEKEFQSQVMNMKQKYGEIPVPAHARDRMLAGIRQAKEEKERSVSRVISLEDRKGRKNMKNHVWMKRTAVAAAAVLVTVGALANISPVTANAMEKLPIIGTLAKVMTFRTFEDEPDRAAFMALPLPGLFQPLPVRRRKPAEIPGSLFYAL